MSLTLRGNGPNSRSITLQTPVILAPMAGVTNPPFRRLCREHGGGLYTSEMVGARGLVEIWQRMEKEKSISESKSRTLLRASFDDDEPIRSIQLYGTDPIYVGECVKRLVENGEVDHIDLNMGCPAVKVTRHGGGAALPWKLDYALSIIQYAVDNADGVPVTVKTRMGIDDDHLYYKDLATGARDLGAAAMTLHARTAEQAYSGDAKWEAIAELVSLVPDMPILGNGDIWSGRDAKDMLDYTGAAGIVIGRGCMGRPWLFRDIEKALAGEEIPSPPNLGEVCDMIIRHTQLLIDYLGQRGGCLEIRKHTGWYLQGFPVGGKLRRILHHVESLDDVIESLSKLDRTIELPEEAVHMKRGHTHGPKPVKLPHNWLSNRVMEDELDREADTVLSGG